MSYAPELEGGAAARCAVGLLQGLQAHGVDCEALVGAQSARSAEVPRDLSVEIVQMPESSRMRARADRLLSPGAAFTRAPLAERLHAIAAEVDVVHLFDTSAASAVRLVERPTAVQLHYWTTRDQDSVWPLSKAGRSALELLRLERRAVKRASWLLANSAEVAEPLAKLAPHADVTLAPLGLDPSHYGEPAALEQPVAGLIGSATWAPTANAVRRLLTHVWPLVRERMPEARLLLAGRQMERARFPELPDVPGVQWRGAVPSASCFLRELGVLLYPLASGSGTKVKVLESLALGVPVVTTPDGAEGLRSRAGVEVDTDDGRIAAVVVELLTDLHSRRAAGAAARANFMENHTPRAAAEPVVRLYERMLA
jgi:glycosyltransferase involved in cell wall biosynthesis